MSSPTNEDTEQGKKFETHYAQLSDNELVLISADLSQLREIARPILIEELKKRGLERETNTQGKTEKRYVGVGGWLAFFVITLVLLSPIASLLEIAFTYAQVSTVLADSSRVILLFSAYALLRTIVMALGVYAGVRLIQIAPNAVRAARTYLIAAGLSGILIGLGAILIASSADDKAAGAMSALQGVIYAIIWFAYLERSRRVAATYGAK